MIEFLYHSLSMKAFQRPSKFPHIFAFYFKWNDIKFLDREREREKERKIKGKREEEGEKFLSFWPFTCQVTQKMTFSSLSFHSSFLSVSFRGVVLFLFTEDANIAFGESVLLKKRECLFNVVSKVDLRYSSLSLSLYISHSMSLSYANSMRR